MSSKIDLSVAEVWCSKLCHDLISPVGAVCNGVEYLQDPASGSADEAAELIALSAGMAADRLKFYRTAYGASGSQAAMSLDEAGQTADAYLKWTKVKLVLPEGRATAVLPVGLGKVFLNLIALLESGMIYGGEIAVELGPESDGELTGFSLVGTGRAVRFAHGEGEALAGEVEPADIEPRSVHAYMTGLFARRAGKQPQIETADESRLAIHVK